MTNIEKIITDYEKKKSNNKVKIVISFDGVKNVLTEFIIDDYGLRIGITKTLKDNFIKSNIIENENEKDIKDFKNYLYEYRAFNLEKAPVDIIRGIAQTKDKPLLDIDFKYKNIKHNVPLIAKINNNAEYVKTLIDTIFLNEPIYLEFIYDFIAQYITQHRTNQRVAIILKGGRGIGKTLFIDILRMMFDITGVRNYDTSRFNSHKANTKLIVYDEADSISENKNNFRQLENIIKKDLGSSLQEIELKGKDKRMSQSSFYLIVATNNSFPITISEKPIDTKNNQFFVCDFKNTSEPLNQRLPKGYNINTEMIRSNLRAFLDKYILNSPYEVSPYQKVLKYDKDNYRYGLVVPITDAELELVESTKTKTDRAIDAMFELIVNRTLNGIKDNNNNEIIPGKTIIDKVLTNNKGFSYISYNIIENIHYENKFINSQINKKGFETYLKKENIKFENNILKKYNGKVQRGYKINSKDLHKFLKESFDFESKH
jgi:hypothetical protein